MFFFITLFLPRANHINKTKSIILHTLVVAVDIQRHQSREPGPCRLAGNKGRGVALKWAANKKNKSCLIFFQFSKLCFFVVFFVFAFPLFLSIEDDQVVPPIWSVSSVPHGQCWNVEDIRSRRAVEYGRPRRGGIYKHNEWKG